MNTLNDDWEHRAIAIAARLDAAADELRRLIDALRKSHEEGPDDRTEP